MRPSEGGTHGALQVAQGQGPGPGWNPTLEGSSPSEAAHLAQVSHSPRIFARQAPKAGVTEAGSRNTCCGNPTAPSLGTPVVTGHTWWMPHHLSLSPRPWKVALRQWGQEQ